MTIKILPGRSEHIEACIEAAINSQLAQVYFPTKEKVEQMLTQALEIGQLHVAVDEEGRPLGFIWADMSGMFSRFPYLRLIAVGPEYRGMGVGKILLAHFENLGAEKADKIFLLVSDFNPRAKKLYESTGYRQVGLIPDFIVKGVSEQLMMKRV